MFQKSMTELFSIKSADTLQKSQRTAFSAKNVIAMKSSFR